MDIKENKIIETILGPSEQFTLPNQIFNAITFSGILISILVSVADLLIDLGRREHNFGFGLIVTVSFIWMYGKSRESGDYTDFTIYYVVLEFILILQSWYMQGGISGIALLITLHCIITIPMILTGKKKYIVLFVLFLMITGLFAAEMMLPDVVRHYSRRTDLLVDIYIVLVLVSAGSIVCVSLVMRNHEIQYERINQFNISLDHSKKALEQKIIEQKETRQTIQKALKEKELLLREIHHRVKNNLQIISSLLILQQYKLKNGKTVEAFHAAGNRIQSIALVHELLYQSDTIAHIDFQTYINKLIRHLFDMFLKNKDIRFDIQADNIVLAIEDAISCGLIVTELVSNSLKYAFPGQKKGVVSIFLSDTRKTGYELCVRDDGEGMAEGVDWELSDTLGLTLVRELVEGQLEGEIELENIPGTAWRIRWETADQSDRS